MAVPRFLYFDLGKVLVRFDVGLMCQQMGRVAGADPVRVHQALFDDSLMQDYERGRVSTGDFYQRFCQATGTCADLQALLHAASDIFQLETAMIPIAAQLYHAGYRLGILSNTCEMHWEYCRRRFAMLEELFQVHALSYRIGAAKPEAAIFEAAAQLAKVAPEEIFFTDDLLRHVEGARQAGFDAVQFTSAARLAAELRARGIQFNY